jgi:hypothetical protein
MTFRAPLHAGTEGAVPEDRSRSRAQGLSTKRATMNEDVDFSRFLTAGVILLLMAFGGWGAFAYSLGSAQLRDRTLQRELDLVAAERQTLAKELDRLRATSDRDRQALEQANRTLASVQQHAAAPAEQKGREAAATSPLAGPSRLSPPSPQPTRQASGAAARQ